MMTRVPVEAVQITAEGFDRIHVFWMNVRPGQGYVTIICYGCAWTAYFGGMSGQTIEQFFAKADVPYLVNKMGCTPTLKQGQKQDAYLAKIIAAVQAHLGAANEIDVEAEPSAGGNG